MRLPRMLAWLSVILFGLSACSVSSNHGEPGALGTVRLSLRGKGPSGASFRLTSGHFTISGAQSATLDTDSDPDAELLTHALVPGDYTITLANGWGLQKLDATGMWSTVSATLVSDNPLAFAIEAATVTDVRFVFRTANGPVVVEPGEVHVGIEVEEPDAGSDAGHPVVGSDFDVLTRHYDNARSGAQLHETVLNTSNVKPDSFGKLYELPVDDQVYAQILHVSQLSIAGALHDVIYVATVNNTVYAFDAHSAGGPLWSRNFNGAGRPTRNTEVGQNCNPYRDFSGNIGIVGTPVIDRASNTMYFVTRTVENNVTKQTLRSIDIITGADTGKGSLVIDAVVPGTGAGQINGKLFFNPTIQNQRLALGLSLGHVYVGWAGFCDTGDYHGWLMSFQASDLKPVGVHNTTPNGWAGGIWQAGAGPVFDAEGNIYVGTGNGDYDGTVNFGETVLKLSAKTLQPLDHFAPSNYNDLNNADMDLGSAGPSWVPGTDLVALAGKEGKLYLLRSNDMGHSAAGDTQIPQVMQLIDPAARPNATHHMHNALTFWEGPGGLHIYAGGENDYLRAYHFNRTSNTFDLPSDVRSDVLPPVGMPGAMVTISADGNKAGTGIVWATTPRSGDANQNVTPGILRAYNAETLALLWDSGSGTDDIHEFAKFSNPTVVNGQVFVASFANAVHVFGLRSPAPAEPTDLALNKPVTGSPGCNGQEQVEHLTDGKIYVLQDGDKFKWCAFANPSTATIDLGSVNTIGRIVLHHAGEGGEWVDYNTRDYRLFAGVDPTMMTLVATVNGNSANRTVTDFTPIAARYVQIIVDTPTQNGNNATRIYELEVYAP